MISALRGPGRRASTVPRSQGEITVASGLWRSARTSGGPCSFDRRRRPGQQDRERRRVAEVRLEQVFAPGADPVPEIRSESGSSSSCDVEPDHAEHGAAEQHRDQGRDGRPDSHLEDPGLRPARGAACGCSRNRGSFRLHIPVYSEACGAKAGPPGPASLCERQRTTRPDGALSAGGACASSWPCRRRSSSSPFCEQGLAVLGDVVDRDRRRAMRRGPWC